MVDLIVIGAGPAGISAAIYAKRANLNVLVLHHSNRESNLEKADKIENYYGFPDGISGSDLYINGINQAQNLGIEVIDEEVLDIKINMDSGSTIFQIQTVQNLYDGKAVVIACGNKKLRPNIIGIDQFEGRGISYCAICDGFFFRNKNVAVIGDGEYALHEANVLANVASNVTILTNSSETNEAIDTSPINSQFNNYPVITKQIKEIKGQNASSYNESNNEGSIGSNEGSISNNESNKVGSIEFTDGSTIDVDGIFIATGEAGSTDFARKLGIALNGEDIIVDSNMHTNIPGIYACGNATGGLQQISKAVYEGTVAGLEVIKHLKNN